MTPLFRYVAYAFAGYILFTGVIGCSQRRLMYHPNNDPPILGDAGVPDMAAVTLKTADGLDLLAWHRSATREGAPTVIGCMLSIWWACWRWSRAGWWLAGAADGARQ